MVRFGVGVMGVLIMLFFEIGIMLKGWGLSPVNWGWIIGGHVAIIVLGGIVRLLMENIK